MALVGAVLAVGLRAPFCLFRWAVRGSIARLLVLYQHVLPQRRPTALFATFIKFVAILRDLARGGPYLRNLGVSFAAYTTSFLRLICVTLGVFYLFVGGQGLKNMAWVVLPLLQVPFHLSAEVIGHPILVVVVIEHKCQYVLNGWQRFAAHTQVEALDGARLAE